MNRYNAFLFANSLLQHLAAIISTNLWMSSHAISKLHQPLEASPRFRHGALWLDALFSILPILLMVFYTLNITSAMVERTTDAAHNQILFNKLISISDYVVKQELAKKSDYAQQPNLVETLDLNQNEVDDMKAAFKLDYLSISGAKGDGTCIYRIVVLQNALGSKSIEKIYICGE